MSMHFKFFENKKRTYFILSAVLSIAVFGILMGIATFMADSLSEQNMAKRWDKDGGVSQVSCFFSVNSFISEYDIESFEHSLDDVLKEDSITMDESVTNAQARLWVDAYSADGKVTVTNNKTSLTADAIGIGGDFFLFHPLKLINGSFFSGNDLVKDYCIIDEDAAWQLFGSNDVAGQYVFISGVPHIVIGVIERQKGRIEEAAGLSETLVYVSYETHVR